MSKKRRKLETEEPAGSSEPARSLPIALWIAYGIGLFCVVGGILTLVFGAGHAGQDTGVEGRDVATLGYMLIAMGLAAIVLTAAIQWTKR